MQHGHDTVQHILVGGKEKVKLAKVKEYKVKWTDFADANSEHHEGKSLSFNEGQGTRGSWPGASHWRTYVASIICKSKVAKDMLRAKNSCSESLKQKYVLSK